MVNRRFLWLTLAALFGALVLACSSGGGDKGATSQPTASRPSTQSTAARSGPRAVIDPRSGPPGTQVTVTGTGWPAGAPVMVTAAQNPTNAAPYAQLTANNDGIFTAKFRIEKAPDGTDLKIGRFDLVARSTAAQVIVPFQVEVPRPVRNPGDGG